MKKEIRHKIRKAFAEETPDLRDRVIAACKRETQLPPPERKKSGVSALLRRTAAVAACLLLFGGGLLTGYLIPSAKESVAAEETRVYLDVNPSLRLALDENNRVLSCSAINEDAQTVLKDVELEGVELKTALHALIGSMYVKGYLNETDNSMLISVDTNDTANTPTYLAYITKKVNEIFDGSEMECSILAQGVRADENLKKRADAQGISVGKMYLVDKLVDKMDEFDEASVSRLSEMSIRELNLIYSMKPEEGGKPEDELSSGNVGGYVGKEVALNAVLQELGADKTSVERYEIFAVPGNREGSGVVYAVTVRLRNDRTLYRFEVDCETGEVTDRFTDGQPARPEPPDGSFPDEGAASPPEGNGGEPPSGPSPF